MSFDLSLPVLLALAIGLATCGEAVAQGGPPPPTVPPQVETLPTDGPANPMREAALDELAALQAEAARQDSLAQAAAEARAAAEAARLALPVVYATGYGLTVTLPAGWDGPVTAQEAAFPGYALYTFDNAGDHAVPGARLRIERIGTLNPVDAERWRRGQSPYGLHGLQPVAPAGAVVLPAGVQAAVALAGGGLRGLTAYARRGTTYWAVQAAVPEAFYTAAPSVLAELLAGVQLPAGDLPVAAGR